MTDERKKRIPINHGEDHEQPLSEPAQTRGANGDGASDPEGAGGTTGERASASGRAEAADRAATEPRDPADEETGEAGGGSDGGRRDEEPAVDASALRALEDERDGYLNDLRRLKAEFENYRRRSQRELSEARIVARGAMVSEFLPVLDNLERALTAAEEHEEAKLVDGVRMTHGAFLDLLQREGVERIDPLGGPFDPELHEALLAQASEQPEGTVIYVMEPGYVLGERLLRPAKVAVSSGAEGEEG